jgi:acyl-CoA synthetase (AMP-forming)/AMP-acid ligase II
MLDSIWDILWKNKDVKDRGITFINENGDIFISYSELVEKAQELSRDYKDKGIKSGKKVVFQIESQILFVVSFWACQYIGAIPVLLNKARTPQEQEFLIKVLVSLKEYVLIDREGRLCFTKDNESTESTSTISEEDVALILFTSGTTREAKGVELSHKNIIWSVLGGFEQLINADVIKDFWISWLPLTHIAGLAGFHIFPVAMSLNHGVMEPFAFIQRPNVLMEKVSEYGATHIFLTNMGMDLLINFISNSKTKFDLTSLKVVMTGSELINYKLCESFLKIFSDFGLRQDVFTPVYGISEAGGACCISLNELKIMYFNAECLKIGKEVYCERNKHPEAIGLVSVGKVHPSVQIKICDQEGKSLSIYHVGLVCIKGNSVSEKILTLVFNGEVGGLPTRESGKKNSEELESYWYNTGDLGVMTEDGLYIIGRHK